MEIQKVVNEKGSDNINSSINQEFSEAELAFEAVHRSSLPFSMKTKSNFFLYESENVSAHIKKFNHFFILCASL